MGAGQVLLTDGIENFGVAHCDFQDDGTTEAAPPFCPRQWWEHQTHAAALPFGIEVLAAHPLQETRTHGHPRQ